MSILWIRLSLSCLTTFLIPVVPLDQLRVPMFPPPLETFLSVQLGF